MKKVFLANFPTGDGSRFGIELQEDLTERGIDAERIDAVDFALDLGNGVDQKANLVSKEGNIIPVSESVIFMKRRRPTSSLHTMKYSSLFLQFAGFLGADCLNHDFFLHDKTIEKPAQYIKLVAHGFRIPRTIIVHGSRIGEFKSYIESIFAYPFVMKAGGSGGSAVWKISKFDDIEIHLNTVTDEVQKETIIIQEFVQSSNEEFRALMFQGEIVAVIKRSSESFYNNYAQGGTVTPGVLTDHESMEVKKVARISGLDYLGVDFMRDDNGASLYMELQTGPSLNVTKLVNPNIVHDIGALLAERAKGKKDTTS